MKTIEELESQYNNLDPWQYETNPDDIYRKKFYLTVLSDLNSDNWKRALDIGAGEGFITRDLPADEIHAIESSDQAASRLPENVKRVYEPQGKYDLIICTGTLYEPYDHKKIYNNIIKSSCNTILIGGICDWIIPYSFGTLIKSFKFPYRKYISCLNVYEIGP